MQVSNVNNINFKAKVNVKIDENFIHMFGSKNPSYFYKFVKETVAAVTLLKEIAPKIGMDEDVIELKSYKGKELDLMYNGGFCGMVGDSEERPFEGILICLKLLANRLNPKNDLLLNYRNSIREPFASSLFNAPAGQGVVGQRKISQRRHKNPEILDYSKIPETIDVKEYQQQLRALNQLEA